MHFHSLFQGGEEEEGEASERQAEEIGVQDKIPEETEKTRKFSTFLPYHNYKIIYTMGLLKQLKYAYISSVFGPGNSRRCSR